MISREQLRNVRMLAYCVFLCGVLPVGVSSQEREAKPLKKVLPVYPDVLIKKGISGTVHLKIVVGADGSVKDVAVHGGRGIFVESASRGVKQRRHTSGGEGQA